jgi:G3E family GTPase
LISSPAVVRAKGFFWVASRHTLAGLWSQAGGLLTVQPLGFWDEDERRQQLAFIGSGMDRDAIVAALDACLLGDEELAGGPSDWARLPDPFPAWQPEVNDH